MTDSTSPDGSTENITDEQKAETADAAGPKPDVASGGAPDPA